MIVCFSSPANEVLKESYCYRSMSVVRRAVSTICFKWSNRLQRLQHWASFNQISQECCSGDFLPKPNSENSPAPLTKKKMAIRYIYIYIYNQFWTSSNERKRQFTWNLVGKIRAVCRSKIVKIVPIGNQVSDTRPAWPFYFVTNTYVDPFLEGSNHNLTLHQLPLTFTLHWTTRFRIITG